MCQRRSTDVADSKGGFRDNLKYGCQEGPENVVFGQLTVVLEVALALTAVLRGGSISPPVLSDPIGPAGPRYSVNMFGIYRTDRTEQNEEKRRIVARGGLPIRERMGTIPGRSLCIRARRSLHRSAKASRTIHRMSSVRPARLFFRFPHLHALGRRKRGSAFYPQ